MRHVTPLLVISLVGLATRSGHSSEIPIPAGLNPRETYHLAFVSVATTPAMSTNIDFYNNVVQADAEMAGYVTENYGVTWRAIVSTPTVAARDNALVEGPVYLLDGTLLATGFDDFWDGTLLAPLELDPRFGINSWTTWTGTGASGFQNLPLGNATERSRTGRTDRTDLAWIEGANNFTQNFNWKLYALSERLVVPVPEPSSRTAIMSLGFAAMSLSVLRRTRR